MLNSVDITNFLFLLIVAVPLGFAVRCAAEWLDDALNFNNIFWKIRYLWIKKYAVNKNEFTDDFIKAASVDIDEQISEVDRVYRVHATLKSRGILCPNCFGTWILIVIMIITIASFNIVWWSFFPLMFLANIGFYYTKVK